MSFLWKYLHRLLNLEAEIMQYWTQIACELKYLKKKNTHRALLTIENEIFVV